MNISSMHSTRRGLMLVTVCLMAGISPVGGDDPSIPGSAADQAVQTSLQNMKQARQQYLTTAKTQGNDNPATQAAKTQYDAARRTWQAQVNARRQLRNQQRDQMGLGRGQGPGQGRPIERRPSRR